MSRKKIKQIVLTVTLLAVMSAFLFACGSRKQTGNSGGVKETNFSAGSEGAKGRYVETALPMPFEDGAEKVLDLIKTPDGSLELYTLKEGEIGEKRAYLYDGLSWSREETFAAEGIPEASILCYSAYDKSGALYVIYRDTEYKAHLAKFPPGNSKEEFSVKIEDSPSLINGLYVMEDGVVLIPSGDHVLVVGEEGAVKSKLPQRNSFSNFTDSHALTANSFLTVGDQGFLRYDTKDWEEKEVIPFQNDETDIYGSLAAGSGDDFYLANMKGIHHMTAQGTVWETVVDGSLNSMGMPSMTVKRLFVGNSNDFYLWYVENENSRLVHYTYDPEMPSVPARTLTVYGLDLTDNQTVKQAASLFQMENPDTRIELIDGTSQSGSTSKADTIRSLNAELLNGYGADVLVLDGLPAEAYIEKGILDDLSGIITPMAESGELYSNIAESFTEPDGSVYQYPLRAILPVIYGDSMAIEGTDSLETLKSWQDSNPDKAIFPRTVYENVLRQMINLYYPELKNSIYGQPDKEKIQFLLETAKTVGDASGCKVVFDVSEEGDRVGMCNSVDWRGFSGLSDYGLLKGEDEASFEMLKGMHDAMLPYAITEKYGYKLKQFNDIYYPKGIIGVTKFGKEKETARKFVEFALSLKVQESDLDDGFPVSKKAAGAWINRTSDITVGLSFSESDISVSAEYPDEQKKSEVMGMLDKLHNPITVDDTLLDMIVSETKGYFDGTQTAAEAAAQFENKAKLYYAE